MRIVLLELPARHTFTGGYLFNARVAAAARDCVQRTCGLSEAQRELERSKDEDEILAIDSLFLPLLEPSAYGGRRVVQLVHSLPTINEARVNAALSAAAGCITTSRFMANTVRARAPGARVHVCVPGVAATPRAERGAHAVPRVLTVAHFEPRKGHLALLDALSGVRDLPWTWQVIGDLEADPACGREFLAALTQRGLASRVDVAGLQSPSRVQAAMTDADVFALLSTREPYGMVYAESIASGTPVVAWGEGGALESVTGEVTGLLAQPHDVVDATRCLRTLLASGATRARMRVACLAAATAFPTWQECARRFVHACHELAGARR